MCAGSETPRHVQVLTLGFDVQHWRDPLRLVHPREESVAHHGGRRRIHHDGETKAYARADRAKLREADRLLGEGADVAEVARQLEVVEQTYHRWRAQYGGMKADDVRRLKELEDENAQLEADRGRQSSRSWRCGRSRGNW